jgi:hypothetical protein
LVSVAIFTIFQSLFPTSGYLALLPTLPIITLFGYLAFGKFNGRDSEVYIFKVLLYASKPRTMIYTRVPDMTDLDERMALNTADNIQKKWNERSSVQKINAGNTFASFEQEDARTKAEKIRQLGLNLDIGQRNAQQTIIRSEVEKEITEKTIQSLLGAKKSNYKPNILLNNQAQTAPIENPHVSEADSNYFNSPK